MKFKKSRTIFISK